MDRATAAPPASPKKPSGLAKGRAGLLKSFRTGELEKVVDEMEEAAEADANGAALAETPAETPSEPLTATPAAESPAGTPAKQPAEAAPAAAPVVAPQAPLLEDASGAAFADASTVCRAAYFRVTILYCTFFTAEEGGRR